MSVLGLDLGSSVKYNPLPSGVPSGTPSGKGVYLTVYPSSLCNTDKNISYYILPKPKYLPLYLINHQPFINPQLTRIISDTQVGLQTFPGVGLRASLFDECSNL